MARAAGRERSVRAQTRRGVLGDLGEEVPRIMGKALAREDFIEKKVLELSLERYDFD